MIPESWLKERLQTTNVQEVFKSELARVGLSDSDLQESLAQGPPPRLRGTWRAFIGQMVAGDELWWFESPPETWGDLAGRSGYALVRAGHIFDSMVTMKS